MSEENKTEIEKTENIETVEVNANNEEVVAEENDNGLAKGDGPEFKWYIAHVLSGFENRVTKTLKERILNHSMVELFAEIYVPEEEVTTSVNGKKRTIKKKFYPGYLMLKMNMTEKAWHLVKDTDKITGFIGGTTSHPQAISDEEAAFMLGQVKEGSKKTRNTAEFTAGDSVKVIEGPFASFVGTVENVASNGKLKVNVSIFGRPTPVELDDSQVEKA